MARLFFHVTHRKNRTSIALYGVDPGFTLGRQRIMWWCTGPALAWAKEHVCKRHGWSPEDLTVYVVSLPRAFFRRTRWRGVYTADFVIEPDGEIPADG
jgi:hypothetical protein